MTTYLDFFMARQPIFDIKKQILGYELFFRDSQSAQRAVISNRCDATMQVAAGTVVCLNELLQQNKKLMINFTSDLILEHVPYALPPEQVIIEVNGQSSPDAKVLEALAALKQDGYCIAVDDFEGNKQAIPLIHLCDIVTIDTLSRPAVWLEKVVTVLQKAHVQLMAKRIENHEVFQLVSQMGFSLFQGFFFQRPENITGRKLNSNEMMRLKLCKLIENDSAEMDKLAETIQADVSISYRLLKFLNSPVFGFSRKITSVKHAITLLGWKQLKSWLRVIIMTDMLQQGKTRELSRTALLRGKLLETIAEAHANANDQNALFLMGLFSLLDSMLDIPMPDILAELPLAPPIMQALLGDQNKYRSWLELSFCFEDADWEKLDALMQKLALDPGLVALSYHKALKWTESYFEKEN